MPSKDSGGQTSAQRNSRTDAPVEQDETTSDASARHEKLTEDVDGMLDEIDDVLETNAEEFVKAFVQKGGQ